MASPGISGRPCDQLRLSSTVCRSGRIQSPSCCRACPPNVSDLQGTTGLHTLYIYNIQQYNTQYKYMIIIYCIVLVIVLILSGGVATIFDRVILLDAFWGLQNQSLKPSRHIRLAFCACLFFHCTRRIHRRLREPGSDATGDQHG